MGSRRTPQKARRLSTQPLTGVGREKFVKRTKEEVGIRASGRRIRQMEGKFELREAGAPYNGHFEAKKSDIRPQKAYVWQDYPRILG